MEKGMVKRTDTFSGVSQSGSSAMVEVASQREQAKEMMMIASAKRFPRDEAEAINRILKACTRPKLAEQACYEYSRGGTSIEGASIRLAEAVAQNWGNIFCGINEVEQRNGESTVEAFAIDLETNTRVSKVFQVPHIRYSQKEGAKALTDPRDIYELVANNGARRLRACILAVIPGDVIDEAIQQCSLTLKKGDEEGMTEERVRQWVDLFGAYGVSKDELTAYCQRDLMTISPAMMAKLRRVYNSLKNGMGKKEDFFKAPKADEPKPEAATETKKPRDLGDLIGQPDAAGKA